jgi:signal transduction histidine kinase
MKQSKAIEIGELLIWAVASLSGIVVIFSGQLSGASAACWSTACVIFSALLIVDAFSQVPDIPGKGVRSAICMALILCGFIMVYFATGFAKGGSAFAFVLAARRLPIITTERNSWLAVGAIVMCLIAMLWWQLGRNAALDNGIWVSGFMVVFVAFSVRTMVERTARDELAIVNNELHATRELLAQKSRADERLRISRDLHDTLGHNLTGLSIQLDVAARRSEGQAAENIREAHAITRLLLADVRDVVGQLRITGSLEFAEQIRRLTNNIDDLKTHLEMPDGFGVDDPTQADTLLCCVQEIITNTRRHAAASNLWIKITAKTSGLDLYACDDGRGTDQIKWGNGLTGMRERFAQHNGRVEVTSSAQSGFSVRAFLPQRETIA